MPKVDVAEDRASKFCHLNEDNELGGTAQVTSADRWTVWLTVTYKWWLQVYILMQLSDNLGEGMEDLLQESMPMW